MAWLPEPNNHTRRTLDPLLQVGIQRPRGMTLLRSPAGGDWAWGTGGPVVCPDGPLVQPGSAWGHRSWERQEGSC